MNEHIFSIILVILGIAVGGTQVLISYGCFAMVTHFLPLNTASTNNITFLHLIGYCAATLVSGACLIGMILLVVNWTNEFPEWVNHKNLFWVGFLVALAIMRLFDAWKNRER